MMKPLPVAEVIRHVGPMTPLGGLGESLSQRLHRDAGLNS